MGEAAKVAALGAQALVEAERTAGYIAPNDLGIVRGWFGAGFVSGWQAHAAQPVSEAAVEAALWAGGFDIYDDKDREWMRAAIEAARRADANTTEGEKA